MRWRIESAVAGDHGVEGRWRALASGSLIPNPCLDPDFIRPAARHLPEVRGLRLFVVEEAGDWIALLPIYRSSRRGSVPVVPGLRASWSRAVLGEPLVAPGHEAAVAECVLTYLATCRHAFWLRLERLDAAGPFARSLVAGVRGAHMRAHVDAYSRGLAVRRTEPTYLTGEGHANLKRLRRQRLAFERSAGRAAEVVDRSSDVRAVEEFMEMEAAGWKGFNGVGFLSQPGHADFLREMCAGFRGGGRLRLWSLQVGEKSLAMKLNLVANDSLFCYAIAFDEEYARVSPGLQLEVENFGLFHDEPGLRVMDSCASANNAFANRLYPDQRALIDVNIGSGLLGRTMVSLVPGARRAAGIATSWRRKVRGV